MGEIIRSGVKVSSMSSEETSVPSSSPHESLFFVLHYMRVAELLSVRRVCRSLRDAIDNDWLIWTNVIIDAPLNREIRDDNLLKITSKSEGKLKSLRLNGCSWITDSCLQRIVDENPLIEMLSIPECTSLTPDGILSLVRKLSEECGMLKVLRLGNFSMINKEHLNTIKHYLHISEQRRNYVYYKTQNFDNMYPIDIDICPKCNRIGIIYDCPRPRCGEEQMRGKCRGCYSCVARCEECGSCLDTDDADDADDMNCLHRLCLRCWLKSPKCLMCNKAFCHKEGCIERGISKVEGLVCYSCDEGTSSWI